VGFAIKRNFSLGHRDERSPGVFGAKVATQIFGEAPFLRVYPGGGYKQLRFLCGESVRQSLKKILNGRRILGAASDKKCEKFICGIKVDL